VLAVPETGADGAGAGGGGAGGEVVGAEEVEEDDVDCTTGGGGEEVVLCVGEVVVTTGVAVVLPRRDPDPVTAPACLLATCLRLSRSAWTMPSSRTESRRNAFNFMIVRGNEGGAATR
jgi:hypothetical protein